MKSKNTIAKVIMAVLLFTAFAAKAQQWDGYTLYSTSNSTTAKLVDTSSATFHTWTGLTGQTGYSSYLLPGGTLLRTVKASGVSFSGGPICGRIQKVSYTGTITWDFTYSTTTYCTHHDICPMPNGNVLLISYEVKTAAEVAAAGCTGFSNIMWPDKIVEVQQTGATTGTVVWEWHAWDHLVQNVNAAMPNYQTSIVNHPELLNINLHPSKDWMHMNGVDYNPILDQVSFSCHNFSEMFIIDHSTTTAEAASHAGGNSGKGGDILYRWGNPANYGASGTQILNVVHDAHWIKEGIPNAGYLVGFNNNGVSMSQSAVDQITTPVNGYNYNLTLGNAYSPSTYTLRHATNGYTSNMGGSQQLPNGNMLVTIALSGTVYEINPAGTSIWTLNTGGSLAKAFRYSSCYINNPAPAIPAVSEVTGTLSATAATTYQWYMNGVLIAGATNQSYTPIQNGIYVVRITDANGCVYRYSPGYHFTTTSIGINEQSNLSTGLSVYPNPSSGIFTINDADFNYQTYTVSVYDAYGKLILNQKNNNAIDLASNTNGIYFMIVTSPVVGTLRSKISLIK